MARTIVDPRFPTRLRQLRQARGLSLRELARTAYVSKSLLSELENGRKQPTLATAAAVDRALDAAGQLAGMVGEVERGPEADRLAYVLEHPLRLDATAVDALADMLAAQRRLDDQCSPHALLPWVDSQHQVVASLARQARGRHAGALAEVAAEWTQFVGWLHAEARHDATAIAVLGEAAAEADAIGSGVLAAQAENFRGYLERQRGNPRGQVRHFLAAYTTPGATGLQRAGDAIQAAHGLALLDDSPGALRLLGQAGDLLERYADEPAPRTAYWLSPTYHLLNLGLAYLGLGQTATAADHLRSGLDLLPAQWRGALWVREYRQALVSAVHQ
jgi:transcriptional regulator with XRE-family HTH domain